MPVDAGIDDAGEQARGLVDEGEVLFLGSALGELSYEGVVGLVRLRENDDAGGFAVEAMHDARAGCSASRSELALGVVE